MTNNIRSFFYFIAFLLIIFTHNINKLKAQNCTVNAGIGATICADGGLSLDGNSQGLIDIAAKWTQVSGTSVIIQDPNDLKSSIIGIKANETYTFRITATCQDGQIVYQDVTYTINPITTANAGNDINGCPGTYTLDANSPGTGESGKWEIVGGNNAGVSFTDDTNPNTTITLAQGSGGTTTIRWKITNTNSCESSDDLVVTNYGGVTPISAGSDQTLSNCYTVSQSTSLNASEGGSGTQKGTWSLVSGPNYPTISDENDNNTNISGLIEGTYVFRWTLSGSCLSGSDDVSITVPAATQDVTSAATTTGTIRFCENSTTKAVLEGSYPKFAYETAIWTQTGGPAGVIITNSTSPSTSVTGLDGSSTYTFKYEITNTKSGCKTSDNSKIEYKAAPSINITSSNQILTCNDLTANITYSVSGGTTTRYKIIDGPYTQSSWQSASGSSKTINFGSLGSDCYGTYTVLFRRYADGYGCSDAYDQTKVTVSKPPTQSNAGTDQILACNVVSTTLAGNDPDVGVGMWTQVSGPNTATIQDEKNRSSPITGLIEGDYYFRWLISGGVNCPTEEDDVKVAVSTPTTSTAAAGADQTVCGESIIYLDAAPPKSGEDGIWTVTPSTGITMNSTDPKAVVSGLQKNTSYTFTWKVYNTCSSGSDEAIVTTGNTTGPSVANAGDDQCQPDGTTTVTMSGNAPAQGETGTWRILSGPNSPVITNSANPTTSITSMIDGTYELEWSISVPGCQTNRDTCIVSITSTADAAAAGTDIKICGSSTNLNATPPSPSNAVGIWSHASGNAGYIIAQSTNPTSSISNLNPGVYELKWTVGIPGCPSTNDNVKIIVSEAPTTANAGPDQTICNATTANLAANTVTSGTGFWSIIGKTQDAPNIVDIDNPTSAVNSLVTGEYTLQWNITTGLGCSNSTDQVKLFVSAPAIAGNDKQLCSSSETFLVGTKGTDGDWTQVTAFIANISKNTPYTAIASSLEERRDYTFQYEAPIIYGCAATTDQVDIQTSPFGSQPDAGTDKNVCLASSSSTTMTATDPSTGTGSWSMLQGPNTPTFTSADYDTQVSNLVEGLYIFEWNVEYNWCSTYKDVVRINVYEEPTTANAGSNITDACASLTELNGNTPTVGIGEWTLISSPSSNTATININNPNLPNTTISYPSHTGDYVFRWTISNGTCTSSTSDVTVTFSSINTPTTPVANNVLGCDVTNLNLDGNDPSIGEGTWTQISGPTTASYTDDNDFDTNTSNLTDGTYEFKWSIKEGGCELSDNCTVTISKDITANAGANQQVCQFENVSLSGNSPYPGTGEWTNVSGSPTPNIISPDNSTTLVAGTTIGTYEFKWKITNGSCTPSEDNTEITIVAKPNISLTVEGATVCDGDNAKVTIKNAENTTTYKAKIGGTQVASQTTTSAGDLELTINSSDLSVGDNYVTFTATKTGCSEQTLSNQATVEVLSYPNKTLTITGNTICKGSNGRIRINSSQNGMVYKVYDGATLVNTKTGTGSNINITVNSSYLSATKTFTVKAYNGSCEVTMDDTPTITVNSNPDKTLSASGNTVCETINGTATITNAENNTTYDAYIGTTKVGTGSGTGSNLDISITASELSVGSNTITFKAKYTTTNCESDLNNSATITVKANPEKDLTINGNTVCDENDGTITIQSSENSVSYEIFNNVPTSLGTVTGDGNNKTFTVSDANLSVGSNTFTLKATLSGCTVDMDNDATITVKANPTKNLTISGNTVCDDNDGTITIQSSQNSVSYEVFNSVSTSVGTVTGDGNNKTFTVTDDKLSVGSNTFTLKATLSGCTVDMDNDATITVKANPTKNLTISGNTVCDDNDGTITIQSSENNVEYEIFDSNPTSLGTVTGDGNNKTFTVTDANLSVGTNTFTLKANKNGCILDMDNDATVTVKPNPTINLTINGNTVCDENDGTITIQSSENNVEYEIFDSNPTSLGTVTGDGNNKTFTVTDANLSVGTNTFTLKANKNGCILDMDNDATVTVKPNPTINLTINGNTVCDENDGTITIQSSENNVEYEIFDSNPTSLGTVTGTNNNVSFTVSDANLSVGTNTFTLKADKDGCILDMDNDATITVKPNPVRTLTINGNTICDENDGTITIQSSENNVQYDIFDNTPALIGSVTGDGSNKTFTVLDANLSVGNNTFTLRANLSGCFIEMDNDPVIKVNPLPDKTLTIQGSTVCENGNGTVTINSSESNINYKAFLGGVERDNADGNTGDLTLTINSTYLASGNNTITIIATNNTTSCSNTLENTGNIEVIKFPDKDLAVTGSTICDNLDGTITINNTQTSIEYTAFINSNQVATTTSSGGDITLTVADADIDVGANTIQLYAENSTCAQVQLNNNATITVKPRPIADLPVSGNEVCFNDNGTITIQSSENSVVYEVFKESVSLGTTTGNGSNLDFTVLASNLVLGNSNLFNLVANKDGCTIDMQNQAIINVNPLPQSDLTTSAPPICIGSNAALTIQSTENNTDYEVFLASNSIAKESGTGSDITINLPGSELSAGVNEFKIIATNTNTTCTKELDNNATVEVYTSPDKGLIIDGDLICINTDGEITIQDAQSNVTYTAFVESSQITTGIGNGANLSLTIPKQNLVIGTNTVVISANNQVCPQIELINKGNIIVKTYPDETLDLLGSNICEFDDGIVTVKSSEQDIVYDIYLGSTVVASETGIGDDLDIYIPYTYLNQGNNTLTATANNMVCEYVNLQNTANVNLTKFHVNEINAYGNTIMLGQDGKIIITPATISYNYTVYQNLNKITDKIADNEEIEMEISHSYLDVGENYFDIFISNDYCEEEIGETIITVSETMFVPEGFSPNNDGSNDYLIINGLEKYPNHKVLIFNRWGNKVYEASPYLNDWDGTNQFGVSVGSKKLPVGVYFYIIETGKNNETVKGYIYLNE